MAKELQCKYEDLSSEPQNHIKGSGHVAGTHDPRAWRAEKLPSRVASSESFGFSKRTCFSI